jgi:hypothetical protein
MIQRQMGPLRRSTSAMLAGMAMWVGGGACTGSIVSGPSDAGADGGSCSPVDCEGMPAPAIAKVCPDGTSVGATLCVRQGSQCGWGFPECPGDAGQQCPALGCLPACPNGILKDKNGCDTCQCAPGTDSGGTGICTTAADCPGGDICGFLESAGCAATGQCFPGPTGARCAIASTVGCGCNGSDVSIDPSCYSGLPSGYQTKPVLHEGACTDSGGACVSQRGGPCGGNTAHPCTCTSGLTCTPGDGGLPFGDVGGTCQ